MRSQSSVNTGERGTLGKHGRAYLCKATCIEDFYGHGRQCLLTISDHECAVQCVHSEVSAQVPGGDIMGVWEVLAVQGCLSVKAQSSM